MTTLTTTTSFLMQRRHWPQRTHSGKPFDVFRVLVNLVPFLKPPAAPLLTSNFPHRAVLRRSNPRSFLGTGQFGQNRRLPRNLRTLGSLVKQMLRAGEDDENLSNGGAAKGIAPLTEERP